jgi:diguanylate cyclase (GGDEF)-like protein/PAS domain S-box-containing protein
MTRPSAPAVTPEAPGWLMPGPLVLRLVLVAVLAVVFAGAVSAWLVTRASGQEAMRRVVRQQTDEVELVARLLSSKIEQSQKVLRTVAGGITPATLDSPGFLEWLLREGLPAVQFFDTIQVVRDTGEMSLNLRAGRLIKAADVDPGERDVLRRTLVDGKPLVSELIAGRSSEARIMFTMPLHREDGSVMGVVAGTLRLQSQGLLPASMSLPARDDSQLLVFTRDGTILSHSDPARAFGKVADEPGLSVAYARWLDQAQPVVDRGVTHVQQAHVVSMAGMPLPQWIVARITPSKALLAPLEGAQREAWWMVAASLLLCLVVMAALMLGMAQPLAQLTHSARQMLRRQVRQHEASSIAWPRAGGEVGQLVRVFQRLGQQSHAQHRRMLALNRQLQSILDHASVGILISSDDQLQVVGRQFCRMLGYTAEELKGRPARTLYADDAEFQRVGARVLADFQAHGTFDGDVCMLRKDGTPVWTRVQGRALDPEALEHGTFWMFEDITAIREAQGQQAWERLHDGLTRLPNRVAFDERMALLLAERSARAHDRTASAEAAAGEGVVMFLDLDHFTLVNDVAGHDAGDDVLRHVARLIESQVRQMGWVARLGGDEFAVVLPGCAAGRGQALAEQLRASVQAWEPSYKGRSFTLGVSIGLVVLNSHWQDVQTVLYAADMACYDAKRAGRNCVETRHTSERSAPAGVAV